MHNGRISAPKVPDKESFYSSHHSPRSKEKHPEGGLDYAKGRRGWPWLTPYTKWRCPRPPSSAIPPPTCSSERADTPVINRVIKTFRVIKTAVYHNGIPADVLLSLINVCRPTAALLLLFTLNRIRGKALIWFKPCVHTHTRTHTHTLIHKH